MRTVAGVDALPRRLSLVVTVGSFDGVHRGHAIVLRTLAHLARERGATAVAVTFEPHPQQVLRGIAPDLLCDPLERQERMAAAGVDTLVVQRFDRAFSEQSADEFVARVARGRGLRGWVMSTESAFGRDRAGTLERVRLIAEAMGFPVAVVPALQLGGAQVSSSRIRALLLRGRLGEAARLLGRRYAVIGTVVPGDRRGRGLGYPTANLAFAGPVCLPPNGIYAVRVSWGGERVLEPEHERPGVASLGVRPTFGGGERLLEAHLFNFDGDLYGTRLRIEFVRRQRGERRFSSVAALVRQMDRDAARARAILSTQVAGRSNDC